MRKGNAPDKGVNKRTRNARAALVMVMLLVGSAVAVYNADSLYLSGRTSLTSQLPTSLTPNATNTLMLLSTDGNGEPVGDEDYSVRLVKENETLMEFTGRTDAYGFAAPEFSVPDFEGEAELVVEVGDQVLTRTVEPVATSHIFLTTDKPIYQPGQTVHARVLVLRSGQAVSGQEATFEVKTPEGDKVLRAANDLNEYGVTAFDYPLSDQLPLGDYELRVTVDGQEAVRTVKVDEYVLPRFEMTLGEFKSWYTQGETADGFLLAKYFFGERVVGTASMDVNLFTGSDWVPISTGSPVTLVEGSADFTYHLDSLQYHLGDYFPETLPDSVLVELNFTVTDTGDHTEHKSHVITYAKKSIVISALADSNVDGETSQYYIVARYPDGSPVASGDVEYWFDDAEGDKRTATTDERGVAVLQFRYMKDYEVLHVDIEKVIDESTYTGMTDLALEESTGLKVLPDATSYEVGDTAYMDVFYDGEGSTDLVYYDVVADGFTVLTGHFSMEGERGSFKVPITSDMGRLNSVRVYKVESNFDVARDVAVIGVAKGGDLQVDISPDADQYLPQDPVGIDISVSRDDVGTPALLGVSIVDRSVFELGSRMVGFEQVLQGLLPQYSDPIYQFMGYIFVGDTPLPAETLSEWREVEASTVETTAKEQGEEARDLQERAVGAWWTVIAALGVVGLAALAALGPRTKQMRAVALVAMLLVVAAGTVVVTLDHGTDEGSEDSFRNDAGWFGLEEAEDGTFEGDGGWGGLDDGAIAPQENDMAGGGDRKDGGEGAGGYAGNGSYTVPTKPSVKRQFFPETWLWLPATETDQQGDARLDLKAPDSITSWDVSVIASTKDALVGLSHENVTVRQDFFVEPDLPAKAYLGDAFPLKVQVYNYGEPTTVTVALDQADWLAVDGPSTASLAIGTGEVDFVEFDVEMTEVGVQELTVTGESATFVDQVVKPLRVKPAGERLSDLWQGRLSDGDENEFNLTLDPALIRNSENAWVKVQGGVEAAVIEGAESYIHYVTGCGEQSLSTLNIDVLAYRTVREGELDEAKLLEYELIVTQGIQHEMQYLVDANNGAGRGIVWFPGDQDVHPWLTSWGLVTFEDARQAGFTVDDAVVDDMQDWLLTQQAEDGSFSFPEWGLYEFNNPKLQSKKLATTAYVTHALTYSGIPTSDQAVKDAVSYIKANVEDEDYWEDPYVLGLALKVLADTGDGSTPLATRIADQLHELRMEDNGTVLWGSSTNMISNEVFGDGGGFEDMYWRNPSFVIESTGYAVQALHAVGKHAGDVDGGIKYLLDHRSSLGGYFSTQDTVVAFQTIYEVSSRQAHVDMDVSVLVDGAPAWSVEMTDENRDLTYLYDLREHLVGPNTQVTVSASGVGFVMFQVFLEQWVPWSSVPGEEPIALELLYDSTELAPGESITVSAVARNNQDTSVKMALVELCAPVGMRFDEWELRDLEETGLVDSLEFVDDDVVRLYINDLTSDSPVSFDYHLVAQHEAQSTLAGCRIFDMYNVLKEMQLPPLEIAIAAP